jgi:8-oxo-dGTP pyrophosphatase MutT (NUDIX family)
MMKFFDFLEAENYFNDETGQQKWGKSAGGMFIIADNTKKALLLLRNSNVHNSVNGKTYYGNVWGIPGGAVEGNIVNGIKREVQEETGYSGKMKVEASYVHNGHYHTFIAIVPNEFTPVLNWEHDDYLWIDLHELLNSGSMVHGHSLIDGFPQFLSYSKNRLLAIADNIKK